MLETRELKITLTDEVWKTLEAKAKREGKTLDDYLHDLLLDTVAGL